MTNQPTTSKSGALLRLLRATSVAKLLPALSLLLTVRSGHAGSATWNLNPISGVWENTSNWTPATIPNGPADVATFGSSTITFIDIYDFNILPIELKGIVFTPGGAASYSSPTRAQSCSSTAKALEMSPVQHKVFTPHSNRPFNFLTAQVPAAARSSQTKARGAPEVEGGITRFFDTSSAGHATINNQPGFSGIEAGITVFFGSATADHGTFNNLGGSDAYSLIGGGTGFGQTASASHATFYNLGATVSGGYGGGLDLATAPPRAELVSITMVGR
jgi:hypothetical protein